MAHINGSPIWGLILTRCVLLCTSKTCIQLNNIIMLACSNAAPSETFKILKSAPNLNALAIAVSIRRPDTRTTPLVLVLVPAKQLRVAMSQMHEPLHCPNVCSMSRYLPLFKLGIPAANARTNSWGLPVVKQLSNYVPPIFQRLE